MIYSEHHHFSVLGYFLFCKFSCEATVHAPCVSYKHRAYFYPSICTVVHIQVHVGLRLIPRCKWQLGRQQTRNQKVVASKSLSTPSEVTQPLRSVGMVQHCDVWSTRDSRTNDKRAVVSSSLLENAINGKNGLADTTRPADRFQRSLIASTVCDWLTGQHLTRAGLKYQNSRPQAQKRWFLKRSDEIAGDEFMMGKCQ